MKKNSLIELYRFLFAMWVVYYHGYFFLEKTSLFSEGRIAVDFFFVLTGFFLINTIDRLVKEPFFKGLGTLIWSRVSKLGLALIASLLCAAVYFFLEPEWQFIYISIFGYMWYIPMMVIAFIVLFTARYFIKNKYIYCLILFVLAATSYALLFTVCKGWGIFRGIGGVSLGVLASQIKKNNFNSKGFNLNILFTALVFAAIFVLAILPKPVIFIEIGMIVILYPALLYFTSHVELHLKPLNFLGSLSFGFYAYQTVLRILEKYELVTKCYWLFLILLGFVLLDRFITFLISKMSKKTTNALA